VKDGNFFAMVFGGGFARFGRKTWFLGGQNMVLCMANLVS
jgi:hypothetical protein